MAPPPRLRECPWARRQGGLRFLHRQAAASGQPMPCAWAGRLDLIASRPFSCPLGATIFLSPLPVRRYALPASPQ